MDGPSTTETDHDVPGRSGAAPQDDGSRSARDRVRASKVAVVVALLAFATACSGDDTVEAGAPDPGSAPNESTAPAESTAPSGSGGETTLTGTVGEEGDPDAFVITLTDAEGEEVTTLPAGTYTVEVNDLSKIHNFHLVGEGVDETTTVPEVVDTSWTVTFEAGEYTYVCDPHPAKMSKTLTVT